MIAATPRLPRRRENDRKSRRAPYIASATSYPIVNTYVPHTPLENAEAFFGIMGCAVAFLGYAFVFEDGVFGAAGKVLFGLKLGEVNTFNEEVRDATEADFAVRPRSGRYVGASTEDDGGDQGVTTDLEFGAGGTITGSGRDSEDGRYTLSGRWGPPAEPQEVARCAWIERYSSRVDISRRAAATPRRRRGYSGETCRGAAAAATRIFREAGSRRRRGRDADIPWRPARASGTRGNQSSARK